MSTLDLFSAEDAPRPEDEQGVPTSTRMGWPDDHIVCFGRLIPRSEADPDYLDWIDEEQRRGRELAPRHAAQAPHLAIRPGIHRLTFRRQFPDGDVVLATDALESTGYRPHRDE